MNRILLLMAHRGKNYMASLWSLNQMEVYGTYRFIDGTLNEVTHDRTYGESYDREIGLAQYTPRWLVQAEAFIWEFLQQKKELELTYRHVRGWLITVDVDLLSQGKPKIPLNSIISMEPYQK